MGFLIFAPIAMAIGWMASVLYLLRRDAAGPLLPGLLPLIRPGRTAARRSLLSVNRMLREQIRISRETERALNDATEQYRSIFENAVEGIIQTSPKGAFIKANPAFARILGYESPEELLAVVKDISRQVYKNPEDRARFRRECEEKGIATTEYEALRKDGSSVWLAVSARTVRDAKGRLRYFESIAEDITERRRAENELRHQQERLKLSEERYRSLVAATAAVVFSTDETWKITTPQPSWTSYTGQTHTQYIDLGWMNAVHIDDRELLMAELETSRNQGSPVFVDLRVWHGHEVQAFRFCELRLVPLRNQAGAIREWVGTLSDVHVKKRSEQELRQFKFMSDNATDAYFVANGRGGLVYVNPAACRLLGFTQTELLRLSATELDVRNGSRFLTLSGEGPTGGAEPRFETTFLTKSGVPVPVEVGLSRFSYLGDTFVLGIARDITERKEVEASLRRHAEELARSNRELERFAYVSSHDLKEPLRMVTLYVQLLRSHLGTDLDAQAREYVRYVIEGAERMRSLISDLLAYSKVGKELTPFGEFEVKDALRSALDALGPSIDESRALVKVTSLPKIVGSYSQVTQLFQNLLSNAIKFRTSETPPVVEICARNREGECAFSIKDNGIGIDPAYFKRIFVIFQRLHTSPRYPGTGIGLSLCQRIVENHGGRIWVESELGKGSTFYFTLAPRTGRGGSDGGRAVWDRSTPPATGSAFSTASA